MQDTSHLVALISRLSNEKSRLAAATASSEIELRTVWVMQIEKEIAAERFLLGMSAEILEEISDADLLAELSI